MGLAAGEGGAQAIKGEVLEADLLEEADAFAGFFKDLAGNLFLRGGEMEVVEEVLRGGDGEIAGFADVSVVEEDGAGFGAEPLASALGAGRVAAVLAEEDADVEFVLFGVEVVEEASDARPGAAAIPEKLGLGFGEVVPGNVGADAFGLGGAEHGGVPGGAVFGLSPGVDGAGVEGFGFVWDDEVGIEIDGVAEALAARAGAVGVVEAEEAGFGVAVGAVAGGALEGCGEAEGFWWQVRRSLRFGRDDILFGVGLAGEGAKDDFSGFAVAGFDGVYEAGAVVVGDGEAVGEDEDGAGA